MIIKADTLQDHLNNLNILPYQSNNKHNEEMHTKMHILRISKDKDLKVVIYKKKNI